MDVVWHGARVVTTFKRSIGWVSWLIVATHIYAIVGWGVDDEQYFFLPLMAYDWLNNAVGATSHEATYDAAVWLTAITGTVGLHVFGWIGFSLLRPIAIRYGSSFLRWQSRIFPVVGWTCWLLVLTLAVLGIGDEIHKARQGSYPNDTGAEVLQFFCSTFCIVGLMHLAVLRMVRLRRAHKRR